jgi:hypothetical protein
MSHVKRKFFGWFGEHTGAAIAILAGGVMLKLVLLYFVPHAPRQASAHQSTTSTHRAAPRSSKTQDLSTMISPDRLPSAVPSKSQNPSPSYAEKSRQGNSITNEVAVSPIAKGGMGFANREPAQTAMDPPTPKPDGYPVSERVTAAMAAN